MADGSVPKVHYFNFRGRGEIVRMTMAAGGMKFEDCRFQKEEWPALKEKARFGQAPFMELNGKTYGQSLALANWVAKETGLYGATSLEQLEIDQIMLLIEDFMTTIAGFYNLTDDAKKLEAMNKLKNVDCPRFFGHFETVLKESGSGYFVGNKLSLADVGVYTFITGFEVHPLLKDFMASLEPYPLIRKLKENVSANQGVREYEERRAKIEQLL